MALSLCSTVSANTGELACDVSRGIAKKFLIFNGTINQSDLISDQAVFNKLVANSLLSKNSSEKVFVLNEVQEIARSSEQNTEGSLQLGYKAVIKEGRPAYTAKIFGGADLLKRLRKFNGSTVRILEIDANQKLWAYKSGNDARGFQAKLFFTGNQLATGQNVEGGIIDVSISIISISEYIDNALYADFGNFNIEDITALMDVPLKFVSNVANVHKISIKIPNTTLVSDYNIFDDYGTAIEGLAANFSAKIGATTMAITSITGDAALKLLTVTYDSAVYTAGAGTIVLTGPTPTQLDAADVTGVELIPATYIKP